MKAADSFQHDQPPCTGVLLTNLGTPDAATTKDVRRYLSEFLWDPRVVEIPRPLWWLILHGIILRTRPVRSAAKYATIWTEAGSPLLDISKRQAEAVQQALDQHCPGPVKVAVAMRYGNPSIRVGLEALRDAGARRLLLLPLYPQYSATTTASTFDAVAAVLKTWRWLPELRVINHYHDDAAYISALAQRVRTAWQEAVPGERLLFSFHGLPKRNLLAGDPYHCECHKTARLVAEELGLEQGHWAVSFQSRFGRAEWLKPYTSELLAQWAEEGVDSVDVICPGFAADCLETLEEIAVGNRDIFLAAGGQTFRYIPALNDDTQHIEVLAQLILQHGGGWPELSKEARAAPSKAALEATRSWAMSMGAKR